MHDQKQPTSFRISIQTSDEIVKYLGSRPYQEVAHLITMIRDDYQADVLKANVKTTKKEEK